MTTQFWDELEITRQFADCVTLKDIIQRIEGDFSERGEVICEIRVNGKVLSEEDEKKFADSPTTGIRDLAIRSNRPVDLIRDAIASALAFIPELDRAAIKTSELMRGPNLHEAHKSFNEVLEGCQWLVDTLMHVRGAASGIDFPIANAERWFEAEKILSQAIRELTAAYSKSDSVLVADLLEYELTGAVGVWRGVLLVESGRRT